MIKNKLLKKFTKLVSMIITVAFVFSVLPYNTINAVEFDTNYVCKDGMALGYSIINGYSKLSIENNQYKSSNKIAVYCGIDISDPYTIGVLGLFYVTNGVDLEKAISNTDYALEKISALDSFLRTMGIKNQRAEKYKSTILKGSGKVYNSFDTVGLYVFDSSDKRALELMNQSYVDCVLDGGRVPRNLKDLNMDGKSDKKDAVLIQECLAGLLDFKDEDIKQYALYVCDINEDKVPDIRDVTALMRRA